MIVLLTRESHETIQIHDPKSSNTVQNLRKDSNGEYHGISLDKYSIFLYQI